MKNQIRQLKEKSYVMEHKITRRNKLIKEIMQQNDYFLGKINQKKKKIARIEPRIELKTTKCNTKRDKPRSKDFILFITYYFSLHYENFKSINWIINCGLYL